jgi:hypothetical protein
VLKHREQTAGVLGSFRGAFRHHSLLVVAHAAARNVAQIGQSASGICARVEAVGAGARTAAFHHDQGYPEDVDMIFRDRQIPSQPEIGFLDHLVLAHFRRGSGASDPAVVKDIDVIGELEALVGVLLDEDDRLPALGQAAKN